MTPQELLEQFRLDVDDAMFPGDGDDSDSLWLDTDVDIYLDEAQKAVARELLVLTRKVSLPIWEGEYEVVIPDYVIDFRRVRYGTTAVKPMHHLTFEENYLVDDYGITSLSDWETSVGDPRILITDMEEDVAYVAPHLASLNATTLSSDEAVGSGAIELTSGDGFSSVPFKLRIGDKDTYEVVTVTDLTGTTATLSANTTLAWSSGEDVIETAEPTIDAWVYRIPDTVTTNSASLMLDDVRHQRSMLHYMKYLAYLKQDADTYDKNLSDRFYALFDRDMDTYRREVRRLRYPAGTVRYGGL